MDNALIIQSANELLYLVLILSLPVVVVTALIGLVVGLLQALTQIQDQTVAFAIKLAGACITLASTFHWMGTDLLLYASRCIDLIAKMGVSHG